MTVILGLESSCDDSAVALVTGDRRILAQAVVGQNAAHEPYGGVVPEIAARAHVRLRIRFIDFSRTLCVRSQSSQPV